MKLTVESDNNIPRYSCTMCYKCKSEFGKSLCKVKNRGCCFYYPKFNLVDIQRMVMTHLGKDVLKIILNTPGTEILNYQIQTKGYFDKKGYDAYTYNDDLSSSKLKDKSLYFKACPFVEDGKGCTLPPQHRTPVCNFFICDEIKKSINSTSIVSEYEKSAQDYWKYYDWENSGLTLLLKENNVNLKKDLTKSLEILKSAEMYEYEFPKLPSCELFDSLILV